MLLRLLLFFGLLYSNLIALETVKVGVLAKRSNDITIKKWQDTADYLSQKIDGYKFEIVPLSFSLLEESVKNKSIDFVLTNTMYYVELEYMYGISRIATLKNISSNGDVVTSFGGVIFTKADSGIKTFDDLIGKRFGAVDNNSFGGWVMAQKELKDASINVRDFLKLSFLGSHDAVMMAIQNDIVDAGTVRTDTFERMVQEGLINPDAFKVLMPKKYNNFPFKVTTALYPEWPFSKLSFTSELLADKVVIALLEMPSNSKAAQSANIAGWTIPLDYLKVLNLLEELHLGPFSKLSTINILRIYKKYEVWIDSIVILFIFVSASLVYILFLNKKLHEKREEIELLNSGLEQKVHKRTKKLKHLYSHEKYIKNILTTIADVNELLITSFSIQSILKNSMNRLAKHNHYSLVLIGLINGDDVEVVAQSKDNSVMLEHSSCNLKFHNGNLISSSIQKVVKQESRVIQKLPEEYEFKIGHASYLCSLCHMIVLPLGKNEKGEIVGVLSLVSKREAGFELEEIKMLESLAIDIGLSMQTIKQKSVVEAMELEKISNYEETILAFVNIIEQRDSYTAGHTLRVAEYCRLIAQELNISEDEIATLEKAAVLHDIGKVVTPDAILLKPGKLTSLEYELIKQHVEAGYRMLSKIDMYKDLAEIIRYHHVRYDGKGYPSTSPDKPDEISKLAYIMVIADAFDAMTSNRIYKKKKSVQDAIEEIKKFSGTQFHPKIAKAAISALENIEVNEEHTQLPNSELEERRFSYFFLDSLTDLYNESYLDIVMLEGESKYKSLALIRLVNFSDYNKKAGWNAGNNFLQKLASELKENYKDGTIFRYQGDDFVVLFKEERVISEKEILEFEVFTHTKIEVKVTHYNLEKSVPIL